MTDILDDLRSLFGWLGEIDGKTICIPTEYGFIDDGIVVAEDHAGALTGAIDEIQRLRAGIDAARSALLKIERQSEEARAAVTRAMRTINGLPDATHTSGQHHE